MAIIRYRVEARVTRRTDVNEDDNIMASGWQYEEVENPHKPGNILTREKAMEMIRESGLVEVHRNKHGVIWDLPDEPMLQKYEGTFTHFKF